MTMTEQTRLAMEIARQMAREAAKQMLAKSAKRSRLVSPAQSQQTQNMTALSQLWATLGSDQTG